MEQEIINRVEILETGELLICLESRGKSMYQYIYREAVGVYWDKHEYGFKSTQLNEWSPSKWFYHIIGVVKSCLNVELLLSEEVFWRNIPEPERKIIENGKAI